MAEPFDDRAKLFYRRFLEGYGAQVESEYNVFFRSRSIDLVAHCTGENLAQLAATIFGHFRTLNALELKGINDPLTLVDYNRIMMRAWGLGAMRKREDGGFPATPLPNARTVTMTCVTRPARVLDELMEAQEMKMVISEETWPYIDQFFREMPEALQKLPSFRDALDESKAEGEAEGVLHTQRQTLLHILRHKFGELPEHVTQRIEETADRTQLVRWLDQALDATDLADLAFV